MRVQGWVKWGTAEVESSKIGLNGAKDLLSHCCVFIQQNGFNDILDTKSTNDLTEKRINFSHVNIWFKEDSDIKFRWDMVSKFRDNFRLPENHSPIRGAQIYFGSSNMET